MNLLMVEKMPVSLFCMAAPPEDLVRSTSECFLLALVVRAGGVTLGCWDALRTLSLIVPKVTCKTAGQKKSSNGNTTSFHMAYFNKQSIHHGIKWFFSPYHFGQFSIWLIFDLFSTLPTILFNYLLKLLHFQSFDFHSNASQKQAARTVRNNFTSSVRVTKWRKNTNVSLIVFC